MQNVLAGLFCLLVNAKTVPWTRDVLDPQHVGGVLIFICLFQHTLIYKGSVWSNLHLVEPKTITRA